MSDQPPPPGSSDAEQPSGQPSPPPPPPEDAASRAIEQRYGGLARRFGARIVDALVVGIPLSIVIAVIPGLDVAGIVASVLSAVIGLAYFVYFETSTGATPGKQILSMRVANAGTGEVLTTDQSIRRNLWMLIGVVSWIPVLGVLASLAVIIGLAATISGDDRNQGFHDSMADAVVLEE